MSSSWVTVSLAELTARTRPICYGVLKPGSYEPRGTPMLRVVDLAQDRVELSAVHRISSELDDEFRRSRLRGGEVLLSIQGTVGRVALAPPEAAGANISRTLAVIEPDDRVDARFLRYFLLSYRHKFKVGGTTRASLNISDLRSVRVPVPPIAEQQRIVAVLEDHLSRLDAAGEYFSTAKARATALSGAVLDTLLTPDGTSDDAEALVASIEGERATAYPSGTVRGRPVAAPPVAANVPWAGLWPTASLEQVTHPIRTISYGILKPGPNVRDGVPYVRVVNMRGDAIDCEGLHRTTPAISTQYARSVLAADDILLSIRGTYGRVCVVPRELAGANITQDTARLAFLPQVLPGFAATVLRSPWAQRHLRRIARGVAVKGVNIGDLREMPFPVPSADEQHRVAADAEAARDAADRMVRELEQRRIAAGRLRRSLLSAAFAGRL